MTRLIQHFCAPLSSPNFFQAIARDQKAQAKRPILKDLRDSSQKFTEGLPRAGENGN
jgi:hypothetical protein